MSGRRGPTLAERRAATSAAAAAPAGPEAGPPALHARSRPVVTRHCWVVGLPDSPRRWAGLLAEWRQDPRSGSWHGRVVYALDDDGATVMVEAWVPASHLQPAR